MEFYAQLHKLLSQDNTGRGLAAIAPAPDFETLADTLLTARRAVILTGFPVDCDGVYRGETDGPGGAATLAYVLSSIGCDVTVLTDSVSLPQVRAAVAYLAPGTDVLCLPDQGTEAFGAVLLGRIRPTHFITIERPGKAKDGHFHSMRGTVIDDMVTDTDFLLPLAHDLGAITIAIGDGGNELGMGGFRDLIAEHVPHGQEIASVEAADITLVAGVSNWWGWGVAALLSESTGRWLLPSPAQEYMLLSSVVSSGGVDGCTHRQTLTVDDQPLSDHQLLLCRIGDAVTEAARQGA